MKCRYCGAIVSVTDIYCQSCGIQIEENKIQKQAVQRARGKYFANKVDTICYRTKWYLSAPFILTLDVLFFPAAIVLTFVRLRDYRKQPRRYRVWSIGLVAVLFMLITLLIISAISSNKWESDFTQALEENRYADANAMLDKRYQRELTPYAIEQYFRYYSASGNYQQADKLLNRYFSDLSDKAKFDSSLRDLYEINMNMFSDSQKEQIQNVFAAVDSAIIAKAEKATKPTEAQSSTFKVTQDTAPSVENTEVSRETEAPEKPDSEQQQNKAAINARSAIDAYLNDPSRKNLKKVKKQEKAEVFTYSKELIRLYVNQYSNYSDYPRMINKYVQQIGTMLEGAFAETPLWFDTVSTLASSLEEEQRSLEAIASSYPFPINKLDSCCEQQFYVTQRLEDAYTDNILGSIKKEIDSYSPKSTSSWVAYNVEYSAWTGAMPGDNVTVIVSDQLNPFEKSGAYTILCYNSSITKQLKDSKGFVFESPVVYMISNPEKMYEDYALYREHQSNMLDLEAKIATSVDDGGSGSNAIPKLELESTSQFYPIDCIGQTTSYVVDRLGFSYEYADGFSGSYLFYYRSEMPNVYFGYVPDIISDDHKMSGNEQITVVLVSGNAKINQYLSANMSEQNINSALLSMTNIARNENGYEYSEMSGRMFVHTIETSTARITYTWYLDEGASIDNPASEVVLSPL